MTPEELVEAARVLAPTMYGGAEYRLTRADLRRAEAAIAVVRAVMAEPDEAMLDEGREASTAWGTYRLHARRLALARPEPREPREEDGMSSEMDTADSWWWYAAEDAEHYYGPFATRDEAIAAAEADTTDPDEITFYICTARPVVLRDDVFDAGRVIEKFEEINEEAWGEDGEPCVDQSVSDAARQELEDMLAATLAAWREKHCPWRAYQLDMGSFANEETLQRAALAGEAGHGS